jgi:ubiquinone/menaquinone biosynthesis C-methylase UbiE
MATTQDLSKVEVTRMSVLDVGCGKGGDFNKWKFAGTRNYVGVDISLKAVQDAAQRKMDSSFC